jgi:hypothetical protein
MNVVKETPMPRPLPYPAATTHQWRLLHSYVVDAVLGQPGEEERIGLQIVIGGMTCADLAAAIHSGERVRVRSLLEDDGTLAYRVEVLTDFGTWDGLCRPPAAALGFDPDEALESEQWLWRQQGGTDGLPLDPEFDS